MQESLKTGTKLNNYLNQNELEVTIPAIQELIDSGFQYINIKLMSEENQVIKKHKLKVASMMEDGNDNALFKLNHKFTENYRKLKLEVNVKTKNIIKMPVIKH